MLKKAVVLCAVLAAVRPGSAAEKGLRVIGGGTVANDVTIRIEGDFRVIKSNGIPDHETGQFPGRGNPSKIAPQRYDFRVPAEPKAADKPTPLRMQPFGVAVNGIVFDPFAAEWWNGDRSSGWQYEPLMMAPHFMGTDASHAHVQPDGSYHYHGIPAALIHALSDGKERPVLVGWAADGFPIYGPLGLSDPKDPQSKPRALRSSYRIKAGDRPGGPGGKYDGLFVEDYEYAPSTGDLDECNGRFGVTPEYPKGIYHYVLTAQFPFIPRQFRGTPDVSFSRRAMRQAGGGGDGSGSAAGRGGFHLIPPFAMSAVQLSPQQQKEVDTLEKETRSEMQKILTAEQMKALDEARPPRRGPGGDGR